MEPNPLSGFLFGIVPFFIVTLIVSIIVAKRGHSGILTFLVCVFGGLLLNVVIVGVGGSSMVAGIGAFAVPAIMLIRARSKDSA